MSETETIMDKEVLGSFDDPTLLRDIEYAQKLTTQLLDNSNEFSAISGQNIADKHRLELNREMSRIREDLQLGIGKVLVGLTSAIIDTKDSLSTIQMIYFDSLLKSVDKYAGFNFIVPKIEVNKFRRLIPGQEVWFSLSGDAGQLVDYPMVSLEYNSDNHTIDSRVVYPLALREISRLWHEDPILLPIIR